MRAVIAALALSALALPGAALAAPPCKDAKGKFVACPKPAPKPTRCKLNGKFARCGTPGAKPA